jgi:LysR family transcriptional regulator, glycine cleavage system transcriptional activator
MDHSVASRHLGHLQSRLGIRLVETSRRGTVLTSAGRAYGERIGAALTSLIQATVELHEVEASEPLEIWCADGLATQWLIPRLPAFFRRYPQIDLMLRPTSTIPDFRRSTVAAKIHYGIPTQAGLHPVELIRPAVHAVASPDWLKANPWIRTPADLLGLPLIHDESRDRWRNWFLGCGLTPPPLAGHCLCNAAAALEAAMLGQGVALANILISKDAIAKGRVQPVLETAVVLDPYVLLADEKHAASPDFSAFRDWLVAELAAL